MPDEIIVLSLSERQRWDDEYASGGLPTQSWDYARALSASGVDPKLAIVRAGGGRMIVPFHERPWAGTTDISTIVGASGASLFGRSTVLLSSWREFATAQGWVAGYIQLSTDLDIATFDTADWAGELVKNHVTFLLDIRSPDVANSFSRTIKRKIKNAALRATLVEEPGALSESLCRLYPLAMHRVDALPHFRFSEETLTRWASGPGSLVLGARVEGSIEAVYLFLITGEHAVCHVTGSTAEGRELVPWLIHEGIARLRDRGVRLLDLGGGVHEGDGVHRFKERFNASRRTRYALCQIYDPQKYRDLAEATDSEVSASSRWFPIYRAPRAT